jgi:hypothetical protein
MIGWVDSILASHTHLSDEDSTSVSTHLSAPLPTVTQKATVASPYKSVGSRLMMAAPTIKSLKGQYLTKKLKDNLKEEELRDSSLVEQFVEEKESIVSSSPAVPSKFLRNSINVDNAFYLSPASGNKKPRSLVRTNNDVFAPHGASGLMSLDHMDIEEMGSDSSSSSGGDGDDFLEEKLSILDSVLSTLDKHVSSSEKKK